MSVRVNADAEPRVGELIPLAQWAARRGVSANAAREWARKQWLAGATRAPAGLRRGTPAWLVPSGTPLPGTWQHPALDQPESPRGYLAPITAWAARWDVPLRTAYHWARHGRLEGATRSAVGSCWLVPADLPVPGQWRARALRSTRAVRQVIATDVALAWWTALSADERGRYVESLFATDGDDRADLASSNLVS